MSAATTMRKLQGAIDRMHTTASDVMLDGKHATKRHTPASLHNLLELNDAANYACILLRAARGAVAQYPNEQGARALARLEHRFTNLVLILFQDFLGDSYDEYTIH